MKDPDTERLDALYVAWMKAEADEQAALLYLNADDGIEARALYEIACERAEEAEEAYADAIRAVSLASMAS
jgi:hypothetical protein